jgi:hypothetical protein
MKMRDYNDRVTVTLSYEEAELLWGVVHDALMGGPIELEGAEAVTNEFFEKLDLYVNS